MTCSAHSAGTHCNLYWSSVAPGTIEYPDGPGDTTCASCMYLHAVLGFFQNARCMMVDRSSPANARETAPHDLNECIEKSPCTSAAAALPISVFDSTCYSNATQPKRMRRNASQ